MARRPGVTFLRFLFRNLLYHWRGNLAVFLGIALGTAVLTGALLVGDSLRGSLRALTLDRLGWVKQAMMPGRFFREQLARELPPQRSSPVILLSGSASNPLASVHARQVGGVTVLGVDSSFWTQPVPVGANFWESDTAEVVLNRTLADLLGVEEGDKVTLHLQKLTDIPRESLLGQRKLSTTLQVIEVKVRQIVPDEGLGSFSLKPTPGPVRNAFVPLAFLQAQHELQKQANAVLVAGAAPNLGDELQAKLTLADWGLRLRTPKDRALAFLKYLSPNDPEPQLKRARWRGRVPDELAFAPVANDGILTAEQVVAFYEKHRPYVSLESHQLFLSPQVVEAAQAVFAKGDPHAMGVRSVFVYLADEMHPHDSQRSHHYVVIGATERKGAIPNDAEAGIRVTDGGIVLVDTPEALWKVEPGHKVAVSYYKPDDHNHLTRLTADFEVDGVVPMRGELDDPDLTPELPGITDQRDISSWRNPPFPYDPKLVTKADEDYWTRYRATPRAYVNMETAHRLWGSRFGQLTAMHFYGVSAQQLSRELLANLSPQQGGFVFQAVRENAEKASTGSADFGVLFLGFSFFLIASALLLVGLLVRLNLDRRAGEIGLLLAIGWDHGRVRRMVVGEGAVLAVLGGLAGLLGALLYARLMLDLLRANWPGGESLSFLCLHAEPLSFVCGYSGSLAVSLLTIIWAARVLGRLAPRALLAGETTTSGYVVERRGWPWRWWILGLALLGTVASVLAGYLADSQEATAGSFFSAGALALTASLAAVWIWLRHTARWSTPRPSLTGLGVRNAGRHAVRSLLTVGLLAAATFLIVAVESFHKEADAGFLATSGGSGGFALVAETDVPLFQDLNRPDVRRELGLTNGWLSSARFFAFRVRGGDDASCLNLYRPLEPRVMGVPQKLLDQKRFHFVSVLGATDPNAVSWACLNEKTQDGTIPAVLDANTAQWILKKQLGETLEVDNDHGEKLKLRVVGLLDESIFQSEVLVSEENFRKLFPRQEGFSFFLIEWKDQDDTSPMGAEVIRHMQADLDAALADQGVRVETTTNRLQAYLAVENTYLATFQALGGLGLVLGALGLGIILMRGVWERRGELALLRALGFGPFRLAWLVLAENLALLLLGLAAGIAAAMLSVAPHLAGAGAHVLWLRIGGLLTLVLAAGLIAGGLAVFTTLRAPVLTALRRE
jgi:ABC-type lipoprotein release transport system permease subunit